VTGGAVTGSAVTGSAVTGSAVTGNGVTGNGVTGGAVGHGAVDYEDLVTAATVGIDRAPLPLDALAGPAAAHAGALDTSDPAAALLDAAALLSAAARAGRPPTAAAAVVPATPDRAPELSRRASSVLYYALRTRDPALLTDLLEAAAAAGFRAAAPMLPALLDVAARDRALRPAVCAVLGERGRWLAAYRAEWQRVADTGAPAHAGDAHADADHPAPDDPQAWATGRREERRAWLAAHRRHTPDEARDLLAAGWARETGTDREEFLEILAIGLSPSDEPFLEAALDDRRPAVRQVAARLLAALPASAFGRRAAARGAGLLRVERRGLKRVLAVTLPETADAAAARDGIGTPPPPGVGDRAWLLTELIAAVPLATWPAALGLDRADLVALPEPDGFGADVHAGWRIAAVAQRDAAWAAALLAAPPPAHAAPAPGTGPAPPVSPVPPVSKFPASFIAPVPARQALSAWRSAAWRPDEDLAAVLPAAARLARAAALLTQRGPSQEAAQALANCPGPWTQPVIDAVLRQLVNVAPATRPSRAIVALFPLAARHLPVAGPRDYVAEIRVLAAGAAQGSVAHGLRQVSDIIERRRYFLQELHP
jgi:Family of unknown function (DUF5691)